MIGDVPVLELPTVVDQALRAGVFLLSAFLLGAYLDALRDWRNLPSFLRASVIALLLFVGRSFVVQLLRWDEDTLLTGTPVTLIALVFLAWAWQRYQRDVARGR